MDPKALTDRLDKEEAHAAAAAAAAAARVPPPVDDEDMLGSEGQERSDCHWFI